MSTGWSDAVRRLGPRAAIGLAVAAATGMVVRLADFATTSIFFVDECWHALVAQAMATHGLFTSTTALMADRYELDYPPLFHLAAAAMANLTGPQAFIWFNLGAAIVLLALMLLAPGGLLTPLERAGAVGVVLATPLFAMYSLRFYTEMLTAVVFFGSWWWGGLALRSLRLRDAAIAGVATGLLIWTKQVGWVVLGAYGLYLGWTWVRGERARRRVAAWIVGIAVLIALPYVALTLARGEHPWLFAFPLRHAELWKAAMAGVEVPRAVFAATLWKTYGPFPLLLVLLVIAAFLKRGVDEVPFGPLAVLFLLLALVFLVDRRLVERHTLFLLPLGAVLGVTAMTRLAGDRHAWVGAVILLSAAVHHVATMPNYRIGFNPSREFAGMTDVIRRYTPPQAKILTLWWVETRYHTGRQVLWPVPNLDDPPVDLLADQPAETWYERIRTRAVTHVLIDDRYVAEVPGLAFSRQTLAHLDTLIAAQHALPLARVGPYRLFEIR